MNSAEPQIAIRRARADEAQELSTLAMRSKAHWPYPKDYLEKCVDALRIDPSYIEQWPVFVAEEAKQVVGFFALKIIGKEPRLDHLWILPEFIGKSIGSRLLAMSVEEARKLGWTEFWLAADPYAIKFYEKFGAVQFGTVQSRIKPDLFLPHMKLDLKPA